MRRLYSYGDKDQYIENVLPTHFSNLQFIEPNAIIGIERTENMQIMHKMPHGR